jgi:hypothetical protein
MSKSATQLTAEAIELIAARLDAIEARTMAEGLISQALLETHPDKEKALAAIQSIIDQIPNLVSRSPDARQVQEGALEHLKQYMALLQAK